MNSYSNNNGADKARTIPQEWLTVYAQPFFYGAITRLPFIYFVIHMRFSFELEWTIIGLFVGCYQAMRVVSSGVSIFFPRFTHIVGTMIGLGGNILVILSDTDQKANIIAGTVLVGCSETLAPMQKYLKCQFGSDIDALEHKLKLQYAAVMVGVTFAFGLGGFVYDFFGIMGVATFGIIMSTGELLSLGMFIYQEMMETDEEDSDPKISNVRSILDNVEAAKTTRQEDPSTDGLSSLGPDAEAEDDPITVALDSFSASGMGANYLSYALCFTFGMEAITIGYNLAVSPVLITEVFEQNTTVIGALLASGAAFGTIVTISIAFSKQGNAMMEKSFPSPLNFLVAMVGISVAVLVAAIPVFPIHIVGLLLLMGFNDLAALLLNEMQGAITSTKAYSTIGPMGQVVRRSGNVITAVTGPILFGIMPQLPYIVAGAVTAGWTVCLSLIIRHRFVGTKNIVQSQNVHESISNFFHSTTFARKEIIARQVKKGQLKALSENTSSSAESSETTPGANPAQKLAPTHVLRGMARQISEC